MQSALETREMEAPICRYIVVTLGRQFPFWNLDDIPGWFEFSEHLCIESTNAIDSYRYDKQTKLKIPRRV